VLGSCREKKMAGYYGLAIFIDNPQPGGQWIQDRQIDIIKSLIAILKRRAT